MMDFLKKKQRTGHTQNRNEIEMCQVLFYKNK